MSFLCVLIISLFCQQAAQTVKVVYPLNSGQKVAIMRNIEKMLAEALNDNSIVSQSYY